MDERTACASIFAYDGETTLIRPIAERRPKIFLPTKPNFP